MNQAKRVSIMLDLNRRGIEVEGKITAKDLRKLYRESGGIKLLIGSVPKSYSIAKELTDYIEHSNQRKATP